LAFLWRSILPTAAVALAGGSLLIIAPSWFAVLLYGDPSQVRLVQVLGCVLLAVISFNVLVELLTALRLVRFASMMQLASSIAFLVIGITLLRSTQRAETAVLLAYGAAACIASVIGVVILFRFCGALPQENESLSNSELWTKLAPFAFWIWAGNLITNLFECLGSVHAQTFRWACAHRG
jgi:O-antigen/teichoic acid export membrane protein